MKTQIARYKINIHSFIDLITNSSSETYICASESTLTAVKEVINNVLALGESKHTADDLFEFSLSKEGEWSSSVYLVVKPKNAEDPKAIAAAKVLSSLTSLFDITSEYNG